MTYRRDRDKKDRRIARKFRETDGAGLEPGESKRFDQMYVEAMGGESDSDPRD